MYYRHLEKKLKSHFQKRKEVLILLGARQVGKTTILKKVFPQAYYLTVDNESIRQNLNRFDPVVYKQIIPKDKKYIVVDEAHLLNDPGRVAKIFYDQIADKKIILTGSSSFRIKNKTSESLAGRKVEYYLYPLTFSEYLVQKEIVKEKKLKIIDNLISENQQKEKFYNFDFEAVLENVLLYGLYPALVDSPQDELYLKNLVDSVVFKDMLDLSLIEKKELAKNLLILLAYQIGSLVNYSELASKLDVDQRTVKRYIQIFEESFIIFTLPPYLGRKRDEISKMRKVYFYDLGLRNALISDFKPLKVRTDEGVLFENFIISEILKENYYGDFGYRLYFWRTKQGQEVDLVLEKDKELIGVEIKLKPKSSFSLGFKNRFKKARFLIVNKINFY
ncbi:MAG: ATP-binding protein [Patescibacteria group bacterium]|nr:ATP-binding protein [Patescibacteria group bacterium]